MKIVLTIAVALSALYVRAQSNTTPCTALEVHCPVVVPAPIQSNVFGTAYYNWQICSNLDPRTTFFYKVKITRNGLFTFLIRPGVDNNGNGVVGDPLTELTQTNYDFAVWLNRSCSNVQNTVPDRLSHAGPTQSQQYMTGLDINATGTCEGWNGSGRLSALSVIAGDEVLIAVNLYDGMINPGSPMPPFQLIVNGIYGGGGTVPYDGIMYELTDEAGTPTQDFCYGDPVYIQGFGGRANTYTVALLSSAGTEIASEEATVGSLEGLNITELFGDHFSPNVSYWVSIKTSGPCGCYNETRPLHFECCSSSTDASFVLSFPQINIQDGHNRLYGHSDKLGTHSWQVMKYYPNYAGTGYVLYPEKYEGTMRKLSYPVLANVRCMYVSHTITNACGTKCSSQKFCRFDCAEKSCNLSAPEEAYYDGFWFSWLPVSGATSYVVEVTFDDPECCGVSGNNPLHPPHRTITTSNTYYQVMPSDLVAPPGVNPQCYSWKVYAVCEDGTRSLPSLPSCHVYGQRVRASVKEHRIGEMTINLIPNPARDNVSISVPSQRGMEITIKVVDSFGRTVEETQLSSADDGESMYNLDTRGYCKGLYLVKASSGESYIGTAKLIID